MSINLTYIPEMQIGDILLIAAIALTTIVLIAGIFLMARGGEANRKYGNKLMVLRVVFQAVSLVILAVLFTLKTD